MGFNLKKFYKRIDKLCLETLGMPLEIVPRSEWGARAPQRATQMFHPVGNVVIWYIRNMEHCETDEECKRAVQEQQRRDMLKGMADIKYNFIIGGNGKTYEGRGWEYQPSLRLPYSNIHGNRIDIAHIGQKINKEELPYVMRDAQKRLIEFGVDHNVIGKMHKILDKDH